MKTMFLSMAIAAMAFGSAKAETINCTEITSVPVTITVQGIYCFKSDKSSSQISGNVIDIAANNVTIDLNGFKLGGLGAGTATNATGIRALNRQNITIRNGSIRGFVIGIELIGTTSGHLVEDVLFDTNRITGVHIEGTGFVIRNNRVVNTGSGDLVNDAFGMLLSGSNAVVADNIVGGTSEAGTAKGISVINATLMD